jgi:hypothetical protein
VLLLIGNETINHLFQQAHVSITSCHNVGNNAGGVGRTIGKRSRLFLDCSSLFFDFGAKAGDDLCVIRTCLFQLGVVTLLLDLLGAGRL